jgi:CheY-like chemotaxis protein
LITRHTLSEAKACTIQRVLVVDDNPVNQRVAVKMLEKLGCRVDLAGTGIEALAAICRHPYPLVFMDCQMPVMNGFDAARRIRAIGLALPIIALTASTIKEDIDECYASGMNYYLSKPVNINELINIINSLTADQGSEYA